MFHLHRLKGEERLTPFHFFTILDRDRYDAAGHWRKDRAIGWAVAACRMVSARRRERPGFSIGKHQMFVADQRDPKRTEERRVGHHWVRTVRVGWCPEHYTKHTTQC